MKNTGFCFCSCVVALMASAVFILSGCQSSTVNTLSRDELYAPFAEQQPVFTGDYVSVANVDEPPKPLYAPAPVYPAEFKKAAFSGEAEVALIVLADTGLTAQVQVVKATNQGCALAAAERLKTWRYAPAVKNGKHVNCVMQVHVEFNYVQ